MSEVIGRLEEQKALSHLMVSKRSEFLIVYGRRRVGKTYLIREFFEKEILFYCTGMNTNNMKDQLEVFYDALLRAGLPAIAAPTSWMEAFRALRIVIEGAKSKGKKVIFLDEISWLDTPRSNLIPAFAHFWNSFASQREDIILVVCGSVTSWIDDNILNHKGELHNRHTKKLRLLPFNLKETEAYLKYNNVNLIRKDIATLYMTVGGIPYYLNHVQKGKGIPQILDDLFFSKTAELASEYANLYPALFKNSHNHIAIVEALAKVNKGLDRKSILEATKLSSGGTFTKTLEELESCGFIIKNTHITKQKENAVYRLLDEYTIFYHKFLNKKTVRSGQALSQLKSFNIWSGFAFENLCFRHIDQIVKALGISGIPYDIFSYLENGDKDQDGVQIDMVIERLDGVHLMEMKYYNGPYAMTKSEASKLNARMDSLYRKLKGKKSIFPTLVTPFGANKNPHYLSLITNELVLDDLY